MELNQMEPATLVILDEIKDAKAPPVKTTVAE